MSRIAKAPINLPAGVEVQVSNGQINVKGPKGQIQKPVNRLVKINRSDDNVLTFEPNSKDPNGWAQAGTARAVIKNMVKGVSEGFERKLELVGVGYRVQVQGNKLVLSLGYSHPVEHTLPQGVTAEAPSNTSLILKGIDNELLGETAANIRSYRKPEPYKGKGVKYAEERIIRKEAKKK